MSIDVSFKYSLSISMWLRLLFLITNYLHTMIACLILKSLEITQTVTSTKPSKNETNELMQVEAPSLDCRRTQSPRQVWFISLRQLLSPAPRPALMAHDGACDTEKEWEACGGLLAYSRQQVRISLRLGARISAASSTDQRYACQRAHLCICCKTPVSSVGSEEALRTHSGKLDIKSAVKQQFSARFHFAIRTIKSLCSTLVDER